MKSRTLILLAFFTGLNLNLYANEPMQQAPVVRNKALIENTTGGLYDYLTQVKANPSKYFFVFDANKAQQFNSLYVKSANLHSRTSHAETTANAGAIVLACSPLTTLGLGAIGAVLAGPAGLVGGLLLGGGGSLISGGAAMGAGLAQVPRLQELLNLVNEYNSLDPISPLELQNPLIVRR